MRSLVSRSKIFRAAAWILPGGALLGDRLRVDFNTLDQSVFYRSLAISGEDYHALPEIVELNIGHFLVGEAAYVGLAETVKRMRAAMDRGRAKASA